MTAPRLAHPSASDPLAGGRALVYGFLLGTAFWAGVGALAWMVTK